MRIAVFGAGYLGTTHAVCMAASGHEVLGVDVDQARVSSLEIGELPFYEPHLAELLRRAITSGRLKFTLNYLDAAAFADVHFIAVGTPQMRDGFAADLSGVDAVIDELAPLLTRPAVIVGKSTVPVGTAQRLAARVRELAPAGIDVELAWCPEFLREGVAVRDTLHPDRIVLGVPLEHKGRAEAVTREIYAEAIASGVPLLVTDLATAELVKSAANTFLAAKISFINAMAEVCDAAGADVTVLAEAIGYDDRIGRQFLNAGLGFGGGCMPKDIRAFMARAGELGADEAVAFVREIDAINTRRRIRMVELTREACGSLTGARVAVLGAAFKPDSDDVRDSPALEVAGRLQLLGASVTVYDPKAIDPARKVFATLDYAESAIDACVAADVVLVLTEWAEFRRLVPAELATLVRQRRIIDGRNCLDPYAWRAAGWTFRGVGRP